MRRKITAIEEGADLPDLTEQQRNFVEGILSGKRSSDAYRAAYDCSTMQQNSVWAASAALRANNKVAMWIAAGRKAGLGSAVVTLEGHIAELERLKEIAIETGNVGAAVQAEQLRGKAQGHYRENLDITVHDPLQSLRDIAAFAPELAAKLAHEQGIEWESETAH